MKREAREATRKTAKLLTTTGTIMLLAATPLIAQSTTDRQMELGTREMILRNVGNTAAPPSNEREKRSIFERINNNFKSIQVLNNDVRRNIIAANNFDYQRIAAIVEEINKRAKDLKLYLTLPPSPPASGKQSNQQAQKQDLPGDRQLKALLLSLDQTINSFVTNPMFKNPQLNDVRQQTRAGQDLGRIIELSGSINQTAKRLRKTSTARS